MERFSVPRTAFDINHGITAEVFGVIALELYGICPDFMGTIDQLATTIHPAAMVSADFGDDVWRMAYSDASIGYFHWPCVPVFALPDRFPGKASPWHPCIPANSALPAILLHRIGTPSRTSNEYEV
jgi:hypothetical protein